MGRIGIGMVLLSVACTGRGDRPRSAGGAQDEAPMAPNRAALETDMIAAIDDTVDPCHDFYDYACGGWFETTELPSDKSSYTRSFSVIYDRNLTLLHTLLEQAGAPSEAADRDRVGSYYAACMDTDASDAQGAAPLQPMLDKVAAVQTFEAFVPLIAELHLVGVGGFWSEGVLPDAKAPDTYTFALYQGGLGLPDRSYYLDESEPMAAIRETYGAHIRKMFELIGDTEEDAKTKSARIVAFETRLAEHHWERADLRDPDRTYNPMDRETMAKLTPGLSWDAFLSVTGLPDLPEVIVGTPSYFQGLDATLGQTDLQILKDYLSWHVIDAFASYLSTDFDEANFAFYGGALSGQQEQEARWKRCVRRTDEALGDLVGQMFVDEVFAGESKQQALTMIGEIEAAFERRLPGLSWMDDTTRARAEEKARAVRNKIGYPDVWRDYEGLMVTEQDAFGNHMRHVEHETVRLLGRVGGPVDKNEWYMTPPTVNAYYNPMANEIAFPAGILQPPFFDASYPAAVNYGAIGMVMGHELTHGFDDTGRKFAADGRLTEWWAPEVAERFEEEAACVRDQYDALEVEPGLHVNGQLTLGENIADLGGIQMAFDAYRSRSEASGIAGTDIGGFSPDQQFFLAFAQGWCTIKTPEAARQRVATDSHSPARFRVNGPLRNTSAFAEAFQCEVGEAMVSDSVCAIW